MWKGKPVFPVISKKWLTFLHFQIYCYFTVLKSIFQKEILVLFLPCFFFALLSNGTKGCKFESESGHKRLTNLITYISSTVISAKYTCVKNRHFCFVNWHLPLFPNMQNLYVKKLQQSDKTFTILNNDRYVTFCSTSKLTSL